MVISKQIANTSSNLSHPIRSSYQDKSTWRTARQIVTNCGVMGLYSGFQLQMGRWSLVLFLGLTEYCPPNSC